jgi:hypothetical protein
VKKLSICSRSRGRCGRIGRKFKDLDSIALDYIDEYRDDALDELASFRNESSFLDCIRRAAHALKSNGKKHPHQRRIPSETLHGWAKALLRKKSAMQKCRSFRSLFDILDSEADQLWGIGELTVYDTALRVGAYLRLEPREVYLHAGTKKGAKALGIDGSEQSIRPKLLPREFQRLRPYEIEDCLCIYADELERLGQK